MNFIRDLKQQEKYKNMLKRKNKEIKTLNNKIDNAVDKINYFLGSEYGTDMELFSFLVDLRMTLKDGDKE